MGKRGKTKTYNFTYRAEVRRAASVEARSLEEAREKVESGEFDDDHEIDVCDMDDVCFDEEEQ